MAECIRLYFPIQGESLLLLNLDNVQCDWSDSREKIKGKSALYRYCPLTLWQEDKIKAKSNIMAGLTLLQLEG